MTQLADKALLPAGMRDTLPPEAGAEAATVARLMAAFAGWGYAQVKPPLIEFEESLLGGSGRAMEKQTFRLQDPISQRMMGLRADMTLQVARIAATRMKNSPRPLRLCYAGEVLRVKGTQLQPERQFSQVGVELIGANSAAGDVEAVVMAVEALGDLGIKHLSVDLGLPTLTTSLLDGILMDVDTMARLQTALERKDIVEVQALQSTLGKTTTQTLCALLEAVGPADDVLARLNQLSLPKAAAKQLAMLADVAHGIAEKMPAITLTIDAVEKRGFEYHAGVTFTLFAKNVRGELGRGGRYDCDNDSNSDSANETATGLTLYMETIMGALPTGAPKKRVFVPATAPANTAHDLRNQGWVTIQGFADETVTISDAAKQQNCTHTWEDGTIKEN